MKNEEKEKYFEGLPANAVVFIKLVVRKMRYRRKVRREVLAELSDHFNDALKERKKDEDKEKEAQKLIKGFGDAKLLGVLLRRAKKRCRPLWQKVAVRAVQCLGIILVYVLLRGSFLFIGKPEVKVNYIAWLNNVVRESEDDSLNAKTFIDEAMDIMVQDLTEEIEDILTLWPGDMNDVEKSLCREFLDQNKAAFNKLRVAVEKPYFWNDYSAGKQDLSTQEEYGSSFPDDISTAVMEFIMPDLATYRRLAYSFRLRIFWECYQGHIKSAIDDSLVLVRLGVIMQGKGLLVEQLVGTAIEAVGIQVVYTLLDRSDVPEDSLERLKSELERLYTEHNRFINIEAEKAFWYDQIQRVFTDDGRGNGRVLQRGIPWVIGDWKDLVSGYMFWRFPDRQAVMERIERLVDMFSKYISKAPYELSLEDKKQYIDSKKESLILQPLGSAYERLYTLNWRVRTERVAVLTLLSLMIYKSKNGEFPAELEELVSEGIIDELPLDSYSGATMAYRKMENGFILYSVGTDMKDNGGEVVRDDNGRIREWADEGDWVFWPVEK
jgi:hypothetical protein